MAHQLETCDFAKTAARARKMDEAALAYTIGDCYEAALAADSLDAMGMPNNSGKYWDEYHTYTAERARRIKAAGSKAAASAAAAELAYERRNA
jgi:hypothetical protein